MVGRAGRWQAVPMHVSEIANYWNDYADAYDTDPYLFVADLSQKATPRV